jgi:aminoglycoside phosphotransferase (APT) family kinase protein
VLGLWSDPGERGALGVSALPDAPTRAELTDRYARATGRDLTHLPFYCVLGLFKLACVMEGSYARFSAGTSDDAFFATLADGVPALARRALEFASAR